MLRSVVKFSVKSSIKAFDKVKYGLGCLKEDVEDLAAEIKSELRAEAQAHAKEQSIEQNPQNEVKPENFNLEEDDSSKNISVRKKTNAGVEKAVC